MASVTSLALGGVEAVLCVVGVGGVGGVVIVSRYVVISFFLGFEI